MIWIILIIALSVRLISLNQSLWLDEAINILAARNFDFIYFITRYPIADFHPPGYFALLWVWIRIFGSSEIASRSLSILFSIGTVWLTYLIGRKLFNKNVGLLGALFLSLAPLFIYYSQEARMYSLAAFAVTLSTYFFVSFFNKEKNSQIGYILSTALIFYSDYVAYFVLPAQILYVLIYKRLFIKKYLITLGGAVALLIPWLVIFPEQLSNGQQTAGVLTGWRNVVGGASFKEGALLIIKTLIGRITFENKIFYFVFVSLVALPFVTAFKKALQKINPNTALILVWLSLPPVIAFLLSFYIPVFTYFRFIFILPAFYLLAATGISQLKKPFLLAIILVEVIVSSLYLFNPSFQREDWKGVVNFLESKGNNQSLVIFENNEAFAPYKYYSSASVADLGGLEKIPVVSDKDLVNLTSLLQNKDQVYLLEYLVDITDPSRLLEQRIKSEGFTVVNKYDFRGVGFVTLYQRSNSN